MADQAVRQEIARLQAWFDNQQHYTRDDERPVFPGSEIELVALSQEVEAWEDENRQELSQEEFGAAVIAAYELGDTNRALRVLTHEWDREIDEWETARDEEIAEKLESDLDRKLFPPEREAILDLLAEGEVSDVKTAWRSLYGKTHSDDEIAAVEAEHKAKLEEMRQQGYSESHIGDHDRETRPRLAEKVAKMKRSGMGAFDLGNREERIAAMASVYEEGQEQKPEVKMEDFDTSTSEGRVGAMEAIMEGRVIDAELPDDASASDRVAFMTKRHEDAQATESEEA